MSSQHYSTAVGDEGGFAPNLKDNKEAIELLIKCIENSGYKPGDQISIALDCAASEFYNNGVYSLKSENSKLTNVELIDYLDSLCNAYPIISIEDPLDENDFVGWSEITKKLANKIRIVGDDLFVTNYDILKDGIENNIANSILIKPNQIGTITETINTINLAKENKYSTIVSHRSGETEDNFIADLSVGTNSGFIKTGSMSRSDRMSKYNQLLRIESENKKYINFG
jgi:enolase